MYENSLAFAEQLDKTDELAHYRSQFHIPLADDGKPCIYLCGNSLGLQPVTTQSYIEAELADWRTLGVEGHLKARHPWLPYHEFLTQQTARLVGALPAEVVVMNQLTVNLHLLMVSFFQPTPKRYKILMEEKAFPSDRYAITSQLHFHNLSAADALIEVPQIEGNYLRTSDIEEILAREGEQIALVLFGGVNYYTGQVLEMERITQMAQAKGCVVGFDLAHAAGNIRLNLHDWQVDFAAWCSYKYLNAGPGAVGGVFVHERHANNQALKRFAGWWGHDKKTRFAMPPDFIPLHGAEGWQLSNPPIFQMAALRASMDIFDEVGMDRLTQKSQKLTGFLAYLLAEIQDLRVQVITPEKARGAQLSIRVIGGDKSIYNYLSQHGVICDWREPDVVRVAPVPLYNTYQDVFEFVQLLKQALAL